MDIKQAGKSLGVWGSKKFHVIGPDGLSGCGRAIDGEVKLAREVQAYYRCRRPGCAGNWPDYHAPGDKVVIRNCPPAG